ncbi:MAG: hypothetical protein EOS36_20205 [Mesorhizobium sp.]|uniref:hypothetical protein n=1 Tax=Mesorhizobium sp. TaxID=1871066 RepID=UPI000FE557DF|nr:hypothetical protein [Mesorhizobium sp.]RWD60682.1 MAG: hypothetical protein EOS36_20205 [Mesorhizobium sp.]
MTKEEVAQHVLCMASRSVVDAEAIRKRLAEECVYVPAPQNPADVLPEGTTFAAAVAMIVDGSLRTRDWDDRIEVGKDGTIAFIIISPNKGRPAVRLLFSGSEQDRKSYYPYTSQYSPNAFDTAYATRVGHWFTYPCKWLAMNGDMIDRAEAAAADEKAKDVDTRAA